MPSALEEADRILREQIRSCVPEHPAWSAPAPDVPVEARRGPGAIWWWDKPGRFGKVPVYRNGERQDGTWLVPARMPATAPAPPQERADTPGGT